jgi:hypothetical protein
VKSDQPCPCGGRHDERRSVPHPPPPSTSARLLDQRFQVSDTLREIPVVLDIGRARRDCDRHRRHTFLQEKLLSLAP